MNFQVVINKKYGEWKFRKDSETIEKYDNDLPDGFHYVGVTGKANNEAEIEVAIREYAELRSQKASQDVVLPLWSKINLMVEKARQSLR